MLILLYVTQCSCVSVVVISSTDTAHVYRHTNRSATNDCSVVSESMLIERLVVWSMKCQKW